MIPATEDERADFRHDVAELRRPHIANHGTDQDCWACVALYRFEDRWGPLEVVVNELAALLP